MRGYLIISLAALNSSIGNGPMVGRFDGTSNVCMKKIAGDFLHTNPQARHVHVQRKMNVPSAQSRYRTGSGHPYLQDFNSISQIACKLFEALYHNNLVIGQRISFLRDD